ncbi:MAG: (E)-4-hydroxy-3-methylbut-2-enyl-diphosphate synthase [Bacteroidales bacterium]|nr:(E)-4-hydroxy-3-methylbut-2-enyl-diphosphate synthase [Bacteroidales bacterium]
MSCKKFCLSLFKYERIPSVEVQIGELPLGGNNPIRIQSMTTTDTNDTQASVAQCKSIIEAGADLVRLTTQGQREAENLKNIIADLRNEGYTAPIVADVHFNPAAAMTAAHYADKVRINPGNFTGEAKRFNVDADKISDEEWYGILREKLSPLVDICRQNETSIRIGVNHGSLSDRIMARFGDTAQGMVASCTEYLDVFESLNFTDIVISIKSSNTRVMVQTVRLLAATMLERGHFYPLHLGVTEAGSDAEGRIKSAAGIGALLIDGIGDTIRVSLTEAPEAEVPVAQQLVDYTTSKATHATIESVSDDSYSPYEYRRRESKAVLNIGGNNQIAVIADATARKKPERFDADIVFCNDNYADGKPVITDNCDADSLHLISARQLIEKGSANDVFVLIQTANIDSELITVLQKSNVVIIAKPETTNPTAELRAFILKLNANNINAPVIPWLRYDDKDLATFQLKAAADAGLLLIDGLIDGLMLSNFSLPEKDVVDTTFSIMQATRSRFNKAEFISCPGCGRTLYDLQKTAATIKEKFGHLRGLKIGIMGCIVNGIGEMADADYGYVGAGRDKISLYRGKELVSRSLSEEDAIEKLEEIIRKDGLWRECK